MMGRNSTFRTAASAIALAVLMLGAAGMTFAAPKGVPQINNQRDRSLKNEVQHAIDKGLQWLLTQQDAKGFWSQADYPALSALALTAFMGDPSGTYKTKTTPAIDKGYAYLLRCVKPDGGIYVSNLANYNTAVAMMAFQVSYDPAYEKFLLNAHNFLLACSRMQKPQARVTVSMTAASAMATVMIIPTCPIPCWPWRRFTIPNT
jgi:hypothetical protein